MNQGLYMDVSIILVSYNTKDLTRDCLKSVYEKTEGLEYDIWVVDNASSDGSPQMIKEEFRDVKLIIVFYPICKSQKIAA